MIFPDNYVIVVRPDGVMIDDQSFKPYTDENDDAAKLTGGKIIRVDSDPADVIIDYGTAQGRLNELAEHMGEWASVASTKRVDASGGTYEIVTYQDGKRYKITMEEMP